VRISKETLMKKVHDRLLNVKSSDTKEDNVSYVSAKVLAHDLNLSVPSVYKAVKLLVLNGTGIYNRTRKGYVLTEFAGKKDDVNAMRKAHGRRTADLLILSNASKHMKERWTTDWERRQLVTAMRPLLGDVSLLEQSNAVLLKAQNSLGV
jgi:biotin operon repressor